MVHVQATSRDPHAVHATGCIRRCSLVRKRAAPLSPPARIRSTWKACVNDRPRTMLHSCPSVRSHRLAAVRCTSHRAATREYLAAQQAA